MTRNGLSNWAIGSSLLGAFVWMLLAGAAGIGKAPLGVIELLLLFAVLVVVPMGLHLVDAMDVPAVPVAERAARRFQPFAAGCAVASFWWGPGRVAGFLTVPWFTVCLLVALTGALGILRGANVASFAANVGRADLALAGGWFLLSRFGIRPMGFLEPIILLTAVHFHYSGFATATIAAAGLKGEGTAPSRLRRMVTIAVVTLPFAVAAGFVFSPVLKAAAAVVFALSVAGLSVFLFHDASTFRVTAARVFLRIASVTIWFGMAWAVLYAVSDYLKLSWITIPQMASRHGVLNAFGFVMLGLLAWLMEENETDRITEPLLDREKHSGRDSSSSRITLCSELPDFVAREFYER